MSGAERTLEGSLAFFVVGGLGAFAWLVATGAAPASAVWLAVIAATSGAIAQALSRGARQHTKARRPPRRRLRRK